MVAPIPGPDPIDPNEPVPKDPAELLPDAPEPLPPPPIEATPDDPGGDPFAHIAIDVEHAIRSRELAHRRRGRETVVAIAAGAAVELALVRGVGQVRLAIAARGGAWPSHTSWIPTAPAARS